MLYLFYPCLLYKHNPRIDPFIARYILTNIVNVKYYDDEATWLGNYKTSNQSFYLGQQRAYIYFCLSVISYTNLPLVNCKN